MGSPPSPTKNMQKLVARTWSSVMESSKQHENASTLGAKCNITAKLRGKDQQIKVPEIHKTLG